MGRAILALLLLASPAYGATCYPVEIMLGHLKAEDKVPWEGGLQDSGHVIAVFASPEGEWTMVRKMHYQGIHYLCAIESGEGWKDLRPDPGTGL